MLSQIDRLKVLKTVYEDEETSSETIEEKTGFSKDDIISACRYLEGKGLLICDAKLLSGEILNIRITSEGTDVIENNKDITKKFEAGVNFGIVNIKWGFQEK